MELRQIKKSQSKLKLGGKKGKLNKSKSGIQLRFVQKGAYGDLGHA